MSGNNVPALVSAQGLRGLQGMAFGLRGPTAVTLILCPESVPEDLSSLDVVMVDFLGEVASSTTFTMADPARALLERLCYWQSVLQRQFKIPITEAFDLRVWNSDATPAKHMRQYQLALAYFDLQATARSLQWLLALINHWLRSGPGVYKLEPSLRQDYEELLSFLRERRVSTNNVIHFLDAAHQLQIPVTRMVDNLYCFGQGQNSKLLLSSQTDSTGAIGVRLAGNKFQCAQMLRRFGIPVAQHVLVQDEQRAVEMGRKLGYPVVIKPADCEQGRGVFAGLNDDEAVRSAFKVAAQFSKHILVEKHHAGEDYRFTVMHGRIIKVMHRRPGGVLGDGQASVSELVARQQGTESNRRKLKRKGTHLLSLDAEALDLLVEEGMTPDSIVPEGQFVPLRRKANVSAGGDYSVIPSDAVHPDNLELTIRAAEVLRLDIAGVDVIIPDIAESWRVCGAIICEVNAVPQIGLRDTPAIFEEILSELLPERGLIPVQLWVLAHALEERNLNPLLARSSTQGLHAFAADGCSWINAVPTEGVYPSTFAAAQALLCDQRVSSAALVMTPDEIRRFGLPASYFDRIQILIDSSPNAMPSTLQPLLQMLSDYSEKVEILAPGDTASRHYQVRTTTPQDAVQ